MAVVKIGSTQPLDMRNPQGFTGTTKFASSTLISIVSGSREADYAGQGFTYSAAGAVTGGTFSGYSTTYNGQLLYSVSGLNVPAATTAQLVQSGNLLQLESTALSGDDTLYGGGNGDILLGFGGNNTFIGGNHTLIGSGPAVDYVAYSGAANTYTITADTAGFKVVRPDGGTDELIKIKSIVFSDQSYDLSNGDIGSGTTTDYPIISNNTIGIYRFFSKTDGTHFFTASTSEMQQVKSTRTDLTFEGVELTAVNPNNLSNDKLAVPVYRFFDTMHGTHFYTISNSERQQILSTRSDLKMEGTAFYADSSAQTGDSAVYRFFDTKYGTHFYTNSTTEALNISATRSDLKGEGVAFYVPTT